MKAAFVKKRNRVKLVDISVRQPEGREVLIRVDACGLCGSDYIDALTWAKEWKRFGHEITGTVVGMGRDVVNFSVDDNVVVALSVPCGECPACLANYPRKCTALIIAEQGGFAEYLLIKDFRLLVKVHKNVPVELACLAEPLTVVLDAFHLSALSKNDHLLVVGGGNIGSLALLAALALNINVSGMLSRSMYNDVRKQMEENGGAHFKWQTIAGYLLFSPKSLQQRLYEVPGRIVVLHTAPVSSVMRYIDALPYDSTIVNIGLSASPIQNRIILNGSTMIFKRIQFMNAFPVPCLYMGEAVRLIQENINLFSLVPVVRFGLDQLPALFKSAKPPGKAIMCQH